jgi:ribonuclease R
MVGQLARRLRAIARAHGLDPRRWAWRERDGRPLATFLEELPTAGAEGRIAQAIHRQAMVINVRSSFQSDPSRHFGVGAPLYARFSSPMREIVGIFVHKETWELLEGARDADPALRDAVVQSANRARELQKHITKEADEKVLDQVFSEDLAREPAARPRRSGTLMGLSGEKAYVLLDDPPLDVKVYLGPLRQHRDQPLVISRNGAVLVHRWSRRVALRIGDAVTVRVLAHQPRRWILDLEPGS